MPVKTGEGGTQKGDDSLKKIYGMLKWGKET